MYFSGSTQKRRVGPSLMTIAVCKAIWAQARTLQVKAILFLSLPDVVVRGFPKVRRDSIRF
jgi:hypothetical protein